MRAAVIGALAVLLWPAASYGHVHHLRYARHIGYGPRALVCRVNFTSRLFGFNGYHSEELAFQVDTRRGVVIDSSGAVLPVTIATPTEIEAGDSERHVIFFPRIGAVSVSSKFVFGALTAGFGKCRGRPALVHYWK